MNLNIYKNVFRDLDGISTSETWFPNKYIEYEIKKKSRQNNRSTCM